MTASQKKSAVSRKRSAGNVGPKPTNVKTFKNGGEVRKIARGCGKVMNNRRKKTKYS